MAKFDFGSMQEFIRRFDVIEHKYLRYFKKEEADKGSQQDQEENQCNVTEEEKLRQELEEKLRQEAVEKLRKELEERLPPRRTEGWTLDEIEDTYQTLQMVYEQQEEESCEIIKAASEKFLGEYVQIDGIGQLFRSSYFYFEWMMHLEYSKKEHDYTYYRDHYIHQVRNMYEMFMFLDKLKYEELCRNLYESLNNKVGELIRESVRKELHCGSEEWEEAWELMNLAQEEKERMLYGYLFHTAAILAALLHDIGYPIAYIGRTVRELGEFVPFSHLFVQEVETISTIHSVLQDSLLYRVAGHKEVAKRVGAKDHGALSAVILLYKYYDSGKITDLSPIRRAAVELAALMIYNHTLKYRNLGEKGENYKNIFRENPMSFLFRLCDDLQEWNRVYFEISRRSNFFVCGNCLMPLTRSPEEKRGSLKARERGYSCWCGENQGRNTTTFAYRRLINVDACTYVEVEADMETESGRGHQIIRVVYDKARLLQIAAYNSSFAMKRGEGIWEIKKMLERQPKFPDTFLDFFVSNNPILLKAEILAEWLKGHDKTFDSFVRACVDEIEYDGDGKNERTREGKRKKLEMQIKEWLSAPKSFWKEKKAILRSEVEEQASWKADGVSKPKNRLSVDYMWDKTDFYFCMAFVGELLQRLDKRIWHKSKDTESERKYLKDMIKCAEDIICQRFEIKNVQEKKLVGLALYHKTRQFDWEQFKKIDSEEDKELYLSAFQHNRYDCDLVDGYVEEETYGSIKREAWAQSKIGVLVWPRYDYYSDYYLYYTVAGMSK